MIEELPVREKPRQVFDNDFVSILIFDVQSLLILKWKRQINLAERKAGFMEALSFTNKHHLNYWLIDDLQLYVISQAEKTWVLTDWVEASTKSSILKLAVVCADDYSALMANTDFTQEGKEQYQAKGQIEHEVFTDYNTAYNWLLANDTP